MLSYDRNFEPTFRTFSKGGRAVPIPCELSDPASVADASDRCTQSVDGCDVLVNNAGFHAPGGLADLPLVEWNRLLTVNLTGCFNRSA